MVKSRGVFLALAAILLCVKGVHAKTTFTAVSVVPGVTFPDTSDLTGQWEEKSDLNGPNVINSLAMANMLGYPIGKANIGGFPSFEAGVALGAGFANMEYYDEDSAASDNGSLPAITPNAILHFGVGLTKKVDVLGKFFTMSKSIADPGVESETITVSDYRLLSAGGKVRYNIVEKQTLIPFIFNFGGITVSLGGDFLYGDFRVYGAYDTELSGVEVDYGPSVPITLKFDGDYDSRILWSLFTISAQAIAYFDIFYLFSLYTGFGLAGNIGYFKFEFNGDGMLTSDDPGYRAFRADGQVGSFIFESKNNYPPYYAIPTYIFGLEINLWIVKVTGETMVNLYNLSDVNAQVGLRIQI
jgi:hypothetical protein